MVTIGGEGSVMKLGQILWMSALTAAMIVQSATALEAQPFRLRPEVKAQLGYSHVFGEVRQFSQGTAGASIRLPIAARISVEPEFTYTSGQAASSVNGLVKVVMDLQRRPSGVLYLATGVGLHASGSPRDDGMTALGALGWRFTTSNGLVISPEFRIAFPFMEVAMPGFVLGFGYVF
jgi:hypothetical protein